MLIDDFFNLFYNANEPGSIGNFSPKQAKNK